MNLKPISPRDRVYIAGPMTGLPEYNYPAFYAMEKVLRDEFGCNVENPAKNFGGDPTHERVDYMRADINRVLRSTVVVFLPGWKASRGANLELAIARELGLKTFDSEFKPLTENINYVV